ncbi:hypothetical protein AWB76_05248 [Caballeronia temeraria]|uniref:Uncharacterized protein n=2 Tax=Caballeronia TaxID=1827195 RepID=A0A158CXM3_9BURK|nr:MULTISPECIES: hypothetical protein [Caballeronia]SAK78748.1 hypothetical protein AWB76_05248 [Caballeronia temeraria]SAK87095.1 hypothetical protein AWB77_04682 [Caballeronia fortuita]
MEADVLYKGWTLSPIAVDDGEFFTAMVLVTTPDGEMRASGALGQFPSAASAREFAIAHGMAEVDRRDPPLPDGPDHSKPPKVGYRVSA